jgi:hypothetical protein
MTYRENCTLPESLLEQVAEQGLGILPDSSESSSTRRCRPSGSSTWRGL